MKKTFLALLIVMMTLPGFASASPQTYTATGEYIMSSKETLEDGIKHAREDALRLISESVGVYVESQTEAKNQVLTQDEIKTMSASIIRVTEESGPVIIQHGNGLDIKMTITAMADTDQLFTEQKKKNDNLTEQNISLQKELVKAQKDAGFQLDMECIAHTVSENYDVIQSTAILNIADENPWKRAYAKKWLGIMAIHEGCYEDGLELCREAVDIFTEAGRKYENGVDTDPVDLLYDMAEISAYFCMDADRAEAYMREADALSRECIYPYDVSTSLAADAAQHAKECIRDLRTNREFKPLWTGGIPGELIILGAGCRS